jgi:hypothetical protein
MQNHNILHQDLGSFRDPGGTVFYRRKVLYRQINQVYQHHYEKLMKSGLCNSLVSDSLLIPHREVKITQAKTAGIYKIIKPEPVVFISYPYAWSFSQLKDAALLTLAIQETALQYGMSLKDASAFNIQFHHNRPILIDTLSFETYQEGVPWVAYSQFCQHFLAPLALMAYVDVRLSVLFRPFIDGIPLDLASRLLPWRTLLNPGLALHLHLHARSQKKFAGDTQVLKKASLFMSRQALLGLLDNLKTTVKALKWNYSAKESEWGEYYNFTNYTKMAFSHKRTVVRDWITLVNPQMVWDLGANTGEFSRLASDQGIHTVAFDIDPIAVEKNYVMTKTKQEDRLLPLFLDLTNPSPAIGWAHSERKSLVDRGPADLVLALALIHHLALSHTIPFDHVARFLAKISKYLILEFVPKSDSQAQKLLATRKDLFPQYRLRDCLHAFSKDFTLLKKVRIHESKRTLLLYKRK